MPSYRNFDTYLKEDHHGRPKEVFVLLGDLLAAHDSIPANARVLDLGCATGALIAYLKSRFPGWSFTGVDISQDLIDAARKAKVDAELVVGSALDAAAAFGGQFDLVLCLGVLGIFDEADARTCVDNVLACLRPGGSAYILAQFNEYDVDVIVKHRKLRGQAMGDWESAWNIYSRHTLAGWCAGRAASVRFIDFSMPYALERKADPVRTWTVEIDGRNQLTNGLKLMVDLSYAEIRL